METIIKAISEIRQMKKLRIIIEGKLDLSSDENKQTFRDMYNKGETYDNIGKHFGTGVRSVYRAAIKHRESLGLMQRGPNWQHKTDTEYKSKPREPLHQFLTRSPYKEQFIDMHNSGAHYLDMASHFRTSSKMIKRVAQLHGEEWGLKARKAGWHNKESALGPNSIEKYKSLVGKFSHGEKHLIAKEMGTTSEALSKFIRKHGLGHIRTDMEPSHVDHLMKRRNDITTRSWQIGPGKTRTYKGPPSWKTLSREILSKFGREYSPDTLRRNWKERKSKKPSPL